MSDTLVSVLDQRADAGGLLLRRDFASMLHEIFGPAESVLPRPYNIFLAEETQSPVLGFPVADSMMLRDLDARLDRWLQEEVVRQVKREQPKEKLQAAAGAYFGYLAKIAENALVSSLLADYHAVFWLAHSFDVARQFCSISKRLAALDASAARAHGDSIKYRIFMKWAAETREQMSQMTARVASVLDGEEERGAQFFRLMIENVLIFTEEFIGPDLRELRPFVNGHMHRDFNSFRDGFERLRTAVQDLVIHDRVFRGALALFGVEGETGASPGLLLDPRFQRFAFEHPAIEKVMTREERDQFALVGRRLIEYTVLGLLRRSIVWMSVSATGEIVAADRRPGVVYSRSTRPIDFGRQGVVDPMVHRFGLMYDITSFSETLGAIARGGAKGEMNSYRQMLIFQRKLETIATRHRLQFEKFLGDGAFYTTRRAIRLVKAAVEIQGFYHELRLKGFAFNKGLRVALNYGYYRLLPMKSAGETSTERVMEFYGPGVVELSRLTTGKANKEIEEIQAFLVAHGYEASTVQQFFSALARGVDLFDPSSKEREFYAYVDANGHLVNEGIVASLALLQELSNELVSENYDLFELDAKWGSYVGFVPGIEGVRYLGIRLIGHVALKGLANIEVGEIVAFPEGSVTVRPLEPVDSLVTLLRQRFHERSLGTEYGSQFAVIPPVAGERELVLCSDPAEGSGQSMFLIGEWDPTSDEILRSIEIPRSDLEHLLGADADIDAARIEEQRSVLEKIYRRLSSTAARTPRRLGALRSDPRFVGYLLGEKVVQL